MSLAELSDQSLRRVLRACRIGLAMPQGRPRVSSNGSAAWAGTDEQLAAKLAAVRQEMELRGMDAMEEDAESERRGDAESGEALKSEACSLEPDWCMVEGCPEEHLRSGLCKKHLLNLARQQCPEASEAVRRYRAIHDRHPEWEREYGRPESVDPAHGGSGGSGKKTPPDLSLLTQKERLPATGSRHQEQQETPPEDPAKDNSEAPAGATSPAEPGETTMAKSKTVTCTICGREFKNDHALGCHLGRAHGEGKPREPKPRKRPCSVCGREIDARTHGRHEAKCLREHGQPPVNQTAGVKVRMNIPAPDPAPMRASAASFVEEVERAAPKAAIGETLIRLAGMLGLAGQIADGPVPGGHLIWNTDTGAGAILRSDGSVEPHDLSA